MKTVGMKVTVLLVAGLMLGGCSTIKKEILAGEAALNMERLIEKNNIRQGMFISYERTAAGGVVPKMIMVDTKTGELIPPCGEVKCRAPFDFANEKPGEQIDSPVQILGEDTYIVRTWKGSICVTIYSRASGKLYEACFDD